MHHITITVMDTLPVLMNTLQADFNVTDDWPWAEQEWRRILGAHPEPLFAIDDITELNISLGDIIAYASLGTRGRDPIWRHPKLRGLYFISQSKVIEKAVAGLARPTFGLTSAKVFGSVEEALADIKQVMAAER